MARPETASEDVGKEDMDKKLLESVKSFGSEPEEAVVKETKKKKKKKGKKKKKKKTKKELAWEADKAEVEAKLEKSIKEFDTKPDEEAGTAGTLWEAEDAKVDLKRNMFALKAFLAQMVMILIIAYVLIGYITMSISLAYVLGAVIGITGLFLIFLSVRHTWDEADILLAIGGALLFIGCGVGCTGSLILNNILVIMILMIFGPLAFALYEIGSCIITIDGFKAIEEDDYGPAIDDMSEYVRENLKTILMMVATSFLMSVLVLTIVAIFTLSLVVNSVVLTGMLLGAILTGASLLLLVKGGRMPKEKSEKEKRMEAIEEALPIPEGAF
jgi:hypothetical protein